MKTRTIDPLATSSAEVLGESMRRRTIAIISHPDAGKSTLTEALLLHAHRITEAGATHGKSGRRATVSDWMEMEQARGISISSAAVQFEHEGTIVNVVDTPGHADFSEDTYRVLAAVDCAVMLIDAAKGMEAQTMKLFDVCRRRGLPVITMINKWDRPGLDPLQLMDEIEERTGLVPTPLTWPVGIAGELVGLLDRRVGSLAVYSRTAGGATIAEEEVVPAAQAEHVAGLPWRTAVDESALLEAEGQVHDQDMFLAGVSTPVLFGAAVLNIGVRRLLDTIVSHAPAAEARSDVHGRPRAVDDPFSGLVFKVQSGMNSAHRDRVAYIRVCSGRFDRGMTLTHQGTGRPFATKYAQQVFGQQRETVDQAWPGDVVGLVNATALRPGDTLFAGDPVEFPPIPRFAPELFAVAHAADSGKHKQFNRGLTQLDHEGVIQVLFSERRGPQQPILAAVGDMQFDVFTERMTHEFKCGTSLSRLPFTTARATTAEAFETLAVEHDCEVVSRADGQVIALFVNRSRIAGVERRNPDLELTPLSVNG